jgi:hypothetical protein
MHCGTEITSCGDADDSRAHAVQPVTALERKYSLWWRVPEQEIPAKTGRTRNWFCSVQPSGQRFSHGAFNGSMEFHTTDFRSLVPRFSAEKMRQTRTLWRLRAVLRRRRT